MNKIGNRILEIRDKYLRMSQDEFGSKLNNMSAQSVSSIEKNKTFFKLEALVLLANGALGKKVNLNYVLTGEGTPFIEEQPKIQDIEAQVYGKVVDLLKTKGLI